MTLLDAYSVLALPECAAASLPKSVASEFRCNLCPYEYGCTPDCWADVRASAMLVIKASGFHLSQDRFLNPYLGERGSVSPPRGERGRRRGG